MYSPSKNAAKKKALSKTLDIIIRPTVPLTIFLSQFSHPVPWVLAPPSL